MYICVYIHAFNFIHMITCISMYVYAWPLVKMWGTQGPDGHPRRTTSPALPCTSTYRV